MGKLVFVCAALLLLLPASALGEEPETDVVWLQNGNKLEGIVVSEDENGVVFQRLSKGRKGQTVSAATLTIPRADVLRIDRMSPEARERAMALSEAFEDRYARLEADLARIRMEPVEVEGRTGWHAVGRHFDLKSTCGEEFAREVTHYLDEVFTAYRQSFDVQRNADRKIEVLLLANQEEYTAVQKALFGLSFENAAFYSLEKKRIVAFNMVQEEEMERIRKEILAEEEKIKDHRARVREQERLLKRKVAEVQEKIEAEVAKAMEVIYDGPQKLRAERLRQVRKWKAEQLELLDGKRKELKEELGKFRREADDAIEGNREIIRKNLAACRSRNRGMYEMLFHEGFHAFADLYLWQRNGVTGVPRWLDEGLASHYEMSAVEDGKLLHGAPHPDFLSLLKDSAKDDKLLPLAKIIGADATVYYIRHKSDAERATLHYAQSWAIVHYMSGRVSRESMKTYVAEVLAGEDSLRAFEKMMGQPIWMVGAAVLAHIQALEMPTAR